MTTRPEARSPSQVGGGNSRPMPPSEALDATEAFLGRFVCFPSEYARVATSLWVAHSYLLEHFDSTPRLAFLSPEPGSGKTRALEVIGSLVRRPMHAVHCTPAALFRAVGDLDNRPTILFDEIDSVFGPKARENEELRAFLNAGHRRSGLTFRCESVGNTHTVVSFASFAAVALAGLHDVPDTIATRSVIVRMRRRGPMDVVEPYRLRVHEPEGLAIGEQLAAALEPLALPEDPVLPAGVTDRPADVWEPLLAVEEVEATTGAGLVGDHFAGRSTTRQITLIQFEHIACIASFLGLETLDPLTLRRNLVVSGINLLGLKDKRFAVGGAVLEFTGPCHPCSRMEKIFGPGGYQATRGHGGITARVVEGGWIRPGDMVQTA